jgi:hypothetical protein
MKFYQYTLLGKTSRFAYIGDSIRLSTYYPCARKIGVDFAIKGYEFDISTNGISYFDLANVFPHSKTVRDYNHLTVAFWKYHVDFIRNQLARDLRGVKLEPLSRECFGGFTVKIFGYTLELVTTCHIPTALAISKDNGRKLVKRFEIN